MTERALELGFTEERFVNGLAAVLTVEDFRVGGEAMRAFYGSVNQETGELQAGMLGQFLNRYAKKWGARVGTTAIAFPTGGFRFTTRPTTVFADQPTVNTRDRPLDERPEGLEVLDAWQVYDTGNGLWVGDPPLAATTEARGSARARCRSTGARPRDGAWTRLSSASRSWRGSGRF